LLADIVLVVVSGLVLLTIMAGVTWLGHRFAWSPELQRKAVHVATGLYATCLPFMFAELWPVLLLIGLSGGAMLVLRHPRLARTRVGATLHGIERKSYGELLLAASIGIVFALSLGKPVLYVLPMAVLTLSDAAAALIGTQYGRHLFTVEAGTKSAEGVVAFFLVTWIVAMIILLLASDIARANVVLLSLLIAAFGAMVEADSWRGLDNLFVPVGIHLFLAAHLQSPPLTLFLLASSFLIVLAAILASARLLKLSMHAARGYTILVFLICAVTAPHNAIVPVMAVLAHLVAGRARPCQSAHPHLDFLAAVACVALFWLFLGEVSHVNALNAYNLTFAGAALVFVTVAAGNRPLRPLFLAAAAVGLAGFIFMVTGWNADRTNGQSLPWAWVVASLLLCMLVPVRWPALLDRHRGPRTVALAMTAPLAAFISLALLP
jgi:dolichol kinase